MLGQRRRRWPSIITTMTQRPVFAGKVCACALTLVPIHNNLYTCKSGIHASKKQTRQDKTNLLRWFKINMRNCQGCSQRYTYTLLHQILT